MLAGRAAEEITFGETTTGAENDIEQLTQIARRMVGRWGMSPAVGMVAILPRDGGSPFGEAVAPRTLELLDELQRLGQSLDCDCDQSARIPDEDDD